MTNETQFGSGQIYVKTYDDELAETITSNALASLITTVCVEANQIGYLKGGFSFKSDVNTLSDKSDLGEMKIDLITEENATCSFALFNSNQETLSKVFPTAHLSTDKKFVEVGGLGDMEDSAYLVIFKHPSKSAGNTYAICVGKNMSGFENAWKQDSVTPFSCSFAAQPYNAEGRYYILYNDGTKSGT